MRLRVCVCVLETNAKNLLRSLPPGRVWHLFRPPDARSWKCVCVCVFFCDCVFVCVLRVCSAPCGRPLNNCLSGPFSRHSEKQQLSVGSLLWESMSELNESCRRKAKPRLMRLIPAASLTHLSLTCPSQWRPTGRRSTTCGCICTSLSHSLKYGCDSVFLQRRWQEMYP